MFEHYFSVMVFLSRLREKSQEFPNSITTYPNVFLRLCMCVREKEREREHASNTLYIRTDIRHTKAEKERERAKIAAIPLSGLHPGELYSRLRRPRRSRICFANKGKTIYGQMHMQRGRHSLLHARRAVYTILRVYFGAFSWLLLLSTANGKFVGENSSKIREKHSFGFVLKLIFFYQALFVPNDLLKVIDWTYYISFTWFDMFKCKRYAKIIISSMRRFSSA